MRSDRDKRSEQEKEIDSFLAQFEKPVEDLSSSDVSSYLEDSVENKDAAGTPVKVKHSGASSPLEINNDGVDFSWNDSGSISKERQQSSSHGELKTASSGLSEKAEKKVPVKADKKPQTEKSFFNRKKSEEKPKSTPAKKPADKKVPAAASKTKDAVADRIKVKTSRKKDPSKESKKGSFAAKAKKANKKDIIDFLFMKDNKVSGKKIFRDIIGLFVLMILCFIIYALGCITLAPGINPHDIYSYVDQSSMIFDDQGKQVDSVYYTENRKITKYEDMPEDLINAFVAIEDKTFWKHHGFNWTRMIGAVLSSFTGGGRISGTSTITQQLARNVYLADTKSVRSIRRKVLEMYYAARLEMALSKEEIVEAYLNTIYLGYGCYGVDAAAKTYFSKNVKDLDIIESAALAALPQAPESYALIKYGDTDTIAQDYTTIISSDEDSDTYVANDISKDRRDMTLGLMKDQGYITEEQYNKYHGEDLNKFLKPTIRKTGSGVYTYFHEYLVDTIISDLQEQYDMSYEDAERMVYTKGLKIYSTMDSTAQEVVTRELADESNFPGISGISNTDEEGNIVSDDDVILLYKYENFFDEDGNFVLKGKEAKINGDGSVTVKDDKRLNLYTTEVSGGTDYSLEFKQTYKVIDGTLYSYPGGYINVPVDYKSLDDSGDLVISAQYFEDYPDMWKVDKGEGTVTITKNAYSLAQKTIQPQSAMVIVGVGTGQVKAMVGGRTTSGEKLLNRALNPRQPGSSIKPLAVYGAALQKSFELQKEGKKWALTDFGIDKQGTRGYGDYITTYSSVADERTYIENRYWPKNASGGYSGDNTFMTAIQQSINTCAVKIQLQIGPNFSAKMLKKFNLSTIVTDESKENNDMNPSALALGGMVNGVIPLEMALAYASFPAGGKVNTPIVYTKVEDRDGKVILESKSEKSEVMDPGVAWIMTEVLKTVVSRGIAGSARVADVQAGGKTGTTNDQYDIWFDGFTPKYAASLWIGTDNNIKMSTLSGPAAKLWGKIMNQIPRAKKGKYKSQPANVISKNGCYFTKGTETGLDVYKPDTEAKKKKAYEKWLEERELHKVWVVDSPEEFVMVDDLTRPIYKTIWYNEAGEEVPEGDPTAVTSAQVETGTYEQIKQVTKEEVGHWEYEKGWREGDFVYKEEDDE